MLQMISSIFDTINLAELKIIHGFISIAVKEKSVTLKVFNNHQNYFPQVHNYAWFCYYRKVLQYFVLVFARKSSRYALKFCLNKSIHKPSRSLIATHAFAEVYNF